MKYKVIGWLDLIFGSLGFLQQILMLFVVYPKLSTLYQDFGAQLPLSTKAYPYFAGAIAIILVLVAQTGAKLAFTKKPSERLFKLGLAALILIFLLGGLYVPSAIFSIISPIYSLTSTL